MRIFSAKSFSWYCICANGWRLLEFYSIRMLLLLKKPRLICRLLHSTDESVGTMYRHISCIQYLSVFMCVCVSLHLCFRIQNHICTHSHVCCVFPPLSVRLENRFTLFFFRYFYRCVCELNANEMYTGYCPFDLGAHIIYPPHGNRDSDGSSSGGSIQLRPVVSMYGWLMVLVLLLFLLLLWSVLFLW